MTRSVDIAKLLLAASGGVGLSGSCVQHLVRVALSGLSEELLMTVTARLDVRGGAGQDVGVGVEQGVQGKQGKQGGGCARRAFLSATLRCECVLVYAQGVCGEQHAACAVFTVPCIPSLSFITVLCTVTNAACAVFTVLFLSMLCIVTNAAPHNVPTHTYTPPQPHPTRPHTGSSCRCMILQQF